MQMLPQVYMHDGLPTSYEAGLLVQPSGVVHRGLPVIDVHPYFTECHDAHQIVVSATHCQCCSTETFRSCCPSFLDYVA